METLVLPPQDHLAYHQKSHSKGIAKLMFPGRRLPRTRSCGSPSKAANGRFVAWHPIRGDQHSSISLGLLPPPGTTKDWNAQVSHGFGSARCSPFRTGTPSVSPILTTSDASGFVASSTVSSLKLAGGSTRSFSTPRGGFLERGRAVPIDGGCHTTSNVILTCCGGKYQERGLADGSFGKETLVSGRIPISDELVMRIQGNRKVTLSSSDVYTQVSKKSAMRGHEEIAASKKIMEQNSTEADARMATGATSLVTVLPRSETKETAAMDFVKICDAGSGAISQQNNAFDLESGCHEEESCPASSAPPPLKQGLGALRSPLLSETNRCTPVEIPKTRANECEKIVGVTLTPTPDKERWAGPAFSNSPPPSSLPYPKFSMRQLRTSSLEIVVPKEGYDNHAAASGFLSAPTSPTRRSGFLLSPFSIKVVGRSNMDTAIATKDLRRILNLDQ